MGQSLYCCQDTLQRVFGGLHDLCAEVQRTSVVCGQHKESEHLQIVFLSDLTDSEEVAKGFGHFTVVDIQETIVQPVTGKDLAVAAFTLGNLIFVMGEDQVLAAGMDIDLLAQIFL